MLSFCHTCHCCRCDADRLLLAKYLFASVSKEKPSAELCTSLLEELDVFLHSGMFTLFWFCEKFWGTYANCKRWLLALSCLSVCLSIHMEQFGSRYTHFHEMWYLSIRQKPGDWNLTVIMGTLCEGLFTFMIVSGWFLFRMRNVSDRVVGTIKTHILYSVTFFWKSCHLWDNVEKYCRARQATDDNITWDMHFACWLTKATDIHSEYVIHTVFPWQYWFCEHAEMFHWRAHCLPCE